jgi:hypothetical protein
VSGSAASAGGARKAMLPLMGLVRSFLFWSPSGLCVCVRACVCMRVLGWVKGLINVRVG